MGEASKIKVLMADDEPDVLDIMAKKVAAQGYSVVKAHDGQEAWDKICKEDPDVILLDLTMPHMTGFEVLKKLRSEPPTKKWQPVIIISAHDEMSDIQEGLALEADHYLTKPCSVDEVIKSIKLLANLSSQRKSVEDEEEDKA